MGQLKAILLSMSWITLFVLAMTAMPTGFAHAYLDPGSGSLIIQIIIGGILAGLVAVRLYWSRIVGLVTGKKPAPTTDDQTTPPGDDVK